MAYAIRRAAFCCSRGSLRSAGIGDGRRRNAGSGFIRTFARRAGARNIQHHCIQKIRDARFLHLIDKASGILGAGQLLMKSMQPEAVMDALI